MRSGAPALAVCRRILLAAAVALAAAATTRADIAPEPGSREERLLREMRVKTCEPGEAMVVCGVRAGVGWHAEPCSKYEDDPSYYLLKAFKYEQAYCKSVPGKLHPRALVRRVKTRPLPEGEGAESFELALEALAALAAMGAGLFAIWRIRRRGASA